MTTTNEALEDAFPGDNAALIVSIESLIRLNDKGALTPHGIGGLARSLLSSAAVRIAALTRQSEGDPKTLVEMLRGFGYTVTPPDNQATFPSFDARPAQYAPTEDAK